MEASVVTILIVLSSIYKLLWLPLGTVESGTITKSKETAVLFSTMAQYMTVSLSFPVDSICFDFQQTVFSFDFQHTILPYFETIIMLFATTSLLNKKPVIVCDSLTGIFQKDTMEDANRWKMQNVGFNFLILYTLCGLFAVVVHRV